MRILFWLVHRPAAISIQFHIEEDSSESPALSRHFHDCGKSAGQICEFNCNSMGILHCSGGYCLPVDLCVGASVRGLSLRDGDLYKDRLWSRGCVDHRSDCVSDRYPDWVKALSKYSSLGPCGANRISSLRHADRTSDQKPIFLFGIGSHRSLLLLLVCAVQLSGQTDAYRSSMCPVWKLRVERVFAGRDHSAIS